jgi:hypothetical protein
MMKHPNKFYGFLSLIFTLMLSGCGTFDVLSSADKKNKEHHLYERQGIDILVESSSLKTTVIKDKDSFERICRSPNPDFASGETSGVSVGLSKGPTIGTSSGAMIDSLGGRSPAVLITRELMYRACELTLNLQATDTAAGKGSVFVQQTAGVMDLGKYQVYAAGAGVDLDFTGPASGSGTTVRVDLSGFNALSNDNRLRITAPSGKQDGVMKGMKLKAIRDLVIWLVAHQALLVVPMSP